MTFVGQSVKSLRGNEKSIHWLKRKAHDRLPLAPPASHIPLLVPMRLLVPLHFKTSREDLDLPQLTTIAATMSCLFSRYWISLRAQISV